MGLRRLFFIPPLPVLVVRPSATTAWAQTGANLLGKAGVGVLCVMLVVLTAPRATCCIMAALAMFNATDGPPTPTIAHLQHNATCCSTPSSPSSPSSDAADGTRCQMTNGTAPRPCECVEWRGELVGGRALVRPGVEGGGALGPQGGMCADDSVPQRLPLRGWQAGDIQRIPSLPVNTIPLRI